MLVDYSSGTCRKICLWCHRPAKIACGTSCRTSTVSQRVLLTCLEAELPQELITCIDINSFYEGHTMDLVTFATRVCKMLGVETMIGAINMSKNCRRCTLTCI